MTQSVSRREVLKYALPAFAGLGTLAATVGAQKASTADMRLIDSVERLVQPEQIKAAVYDGALVYVSELRPGATFDSSRLHASMRTGYGRRVFKP